MGNDRMIVLGFIIVVIISCKLWNRIAFIQYEKNKVQNGKRIKYGAYVENLKKIELVGVGDDGNSDFEFMQAVKKIEVPNDIRIKIYD